MTEKNSNRLSRNDIEAVLFSDNSGARSEFQRLFPELLQQFIDESEVALGCFQRFDRDLIADIRVAYTKEFIFSAFNSSLISCHLLISGFLIPSGNLMRHYTEAYAMALLCSHHKIDVLNRINSTPPTFSFNNAVNYVQKKRNAKLLMIDNCGWTSFNKIVKFYHEYSHASLFSLSTQVLSGKPGARVLGGWFDDSKQEAYRKELGLRISSMRLLCDLVAVVRKNVRVAQTNSLIE